MFGRGSIPHRPIQGNTTSSLWLATCEWASLLLSGTAELARDDVGPEGPKAPTRLILAGSQLPGLDSNQQPSG